MPLICTGSLYDTELSGRYLASRSREFARQNAESGDRERNDPRRARNNKGRDEDGRAARRSGKAAPRLRYSNFARGRNLSAYKVPGPRKRNSGRSHGTMPEHGCREALERNPVVCARPRDSNGGAIVIRV